MIEVKGSFEVKGSPLEMDEVSKELGVMRRKFEKKFDGPLKGTSVVSMMGIMNQDLGSGAYVALEKLTGSLNGKDGTFCLQHSCSMARGAQQQSITVVPDSGTGGFKGIEGSMTIDIVNGQHFYTFVYLINEN